MTLNKNDIGCWNVEHWKVAREYAEKHGLVGKTKDELRKYIDDLQKGENKT